MAEKYLRIMQDGVTSYVPDNRQTRSFWANYNKRVAGGRNATNEIVTWQPATDEEVAFMTKPASETSANIQRQANVAAATEEQLAKLQQQLLSQQELINKLLLEKMSPTQDDKPTSSAETESNTAPGLQASALNSEPEKVKGKPGPKPKTENDGKDETKVNTEA